MGNLRRRLMLVSLIMLCVIPQQFVRATPLQAPIEVDLSWVKDLEPIMILNVLTFLTLYFVLRYQNNQQKVSVPTPEGGSKKVHTNEYVGSIMTDVLEFLRDSKAKDRTFFEGITESLKISNGAVVQALDALKEALIQGNGNQITSMMEVRDEFHDGVQQMRNHRGELTEGLTLLQTRVGSVQSEGVKMNKGIDDLLTETRKLAVSMQNILDRLSKVEAVTGANAKSTEALAKDVDELRGLMDHFASLMHDLTDAVRQAEAKIVQPPALLLNPPGPVAPETKEETPDGKPTSAG